MKVINKLLCLILVLSSCNSPKEMRQEKKIGINGETIYVYNDNGSLNLVFKEEYSILSYTVFLKNDTVVLGDDFTSIIVVANPIYKITINSPESKIINGSTSDNTDMYTFRPTKEGVYNYRGTIEFDSTVVPFEYKFIVVKK